VKGKVFSALALAAVLFSALAGCLSAPVPSSIKQLQSVEVREYQGKNLSSIADFRENSIHGPQHVDIDTYRLKIDGLVKQPTSLTYDDVLMDNTKYQKVVTLNCVEGWSATLLWEGVLVKDLIDKAGGADPKAKVVIFHAYDGYVTSLPLQYVMDRNLILAYKMNDVVLPPERGYPFELVAEDKWGYKWIKWVTEIQLSDDLSFRGYWEGAGYSNDADINQPFFER